MVATLGNLGMGLGLGMWAAPGAAPLSPPIDVAAILMPNGTVGFPSFIAANATWIFAGNFDAWTPVQYQGSVECYNRSTQMWSRILAPEPPNPSNAGFGSHAWITGNALYIGCYGYPNSSTNYGRIYKYDATTLAYLGVVNEAGAPVPAFNRWLGYAFAAHDSYLYAGAGPFAGAPSTLQVYHNDSYQSTFNLSGAANFGTTVEASPDGAFLLCANGTSTPELVVLAVSGGGGTLTVLQRIPTVAALYSVWDADSLGFWALTAAGPWHHYRSYGGSPFAITADVMPGSPMIVSPAAIGTGVLAVYADRIDLIVAGAATHSWPAPGGRSFANPGRPAFVKLGGGYFAAALDSYYLGIGAEAGHS